MEADIREIGPRHLEHVVGIGQKYISPLTVGGHKLVFTTFEICQSVGIVAFYPARFVERYGFPAALCAVFVQQAILNHLELQLTYGAYDFSAIELIGKQLSHTFVHKLLYAFFELF